MVYLLRQGMSDNNSETSTTTNDFDRQVKCLIGLIESYSSKAVNYLSNGDLKTALACTRNARGFVDMLEELTNEPVYGIVKVA